MKLFDSFFLYLQYHITYRSRVSLQDPFIGSGINSSKSLTTLLLHMYWKNSHDLYPAIEARGLTHFVIYLSPVLIFFRLPPGDLRFADNILFVYFILCIKESA